MASNLERKQFDFTAILTAVVAGTFVGTASYAFVTDKIAWEMYQAAVGAPAMLLVGYWARGQKQGDVNG